MPGSLMQESLFPALLASLPPLVSLYEGPRLISPIALNSRFKFLSDADRKLIKSVRNTLEQVNLTAIGTQAMLQNLIAELESRSQDMVLLDYLKWYRNLYRRIGQLRQQQAVEAAAQSTMDGEKKRMEARQNLNVCSFVDFDCRLSTSEADMLEKRFAALQVHKIHDWLLRNTWQRTFIYPEERTSDFCRMGFYIIRWHLAREARMQNPAQARDYLQLASDRIVSGFAENPAAQTETTMGAES